MTTIDDPTSSTKCRRQLHRQNTLSMLQDDKASDQSLSNASHATTSCSFAGVCRPSFGILENVRAIGFNRDNFAERQDSCEAMGKEEHEITGSKSKNVLSRLIACLVSMEYQIDH